MMGLADFYDKQRYHHQTVVYNVSLPAEEVLEKINEVAVTCGHRLVKKAASGSALLPGRYGGSADACARAHRYQLAVGCDAGPDPDDVVCLPGA